MSTTDGSDLNTSLHDAEDRLQAAIRSGDTAALDQLLDDLVMYTSPDGQQVNKRDDLATHASGSVRVPHFVEHERRVIVVATTGVTRILASLEGVAWGQPFAVRLRYTRTWVHDGGWRVIAAHASLAA